MQRLVLFAKRPVPGAVKTRLIPALEPEQALILHRAFVADQLRFLRRFEDRCAIELCADGPWPADPVTAPWLADLPVTEQGPGDLGRRLLRCFRRTWAAGAPATVVLGADAPTVPAGHVRAALRALEEGADAVLSPAPDGGYVLIGMGRPRSELFDRVPWGGPHVLAVTLARARRHGIDVVRIAPWYDVDTPADLGRLRHDLAAPGAARRAPATAEVLARLPGPVV